MHVDEILTLADEEDKATVAKTVANLERACLKLLAEAESLDIPHDRVLIAKAYVTDVLKLLEVLPTLNSTAGLACITSFVTIMVRQPWDLHVLIDVMVEAIMTKPKRRF